MADAAAKANKKALKKRGKKGQEPEAAPAPSDPPLSGVMKAALWLLSVEDDLAVTVLSHMEEAEIAAISSAVQGLPKVTPTQLAKVHGEFNTMLATDPMALKGSGMNYLKDIASRAFGDERAMQVLGLAEPPPEEQPGLDAADIDVLAGLLKQEHPQIAAAVLANVAPDRAAELLRRLPETMKKDVIQRVARLSRVPRAVLDHAEKLLSAGLPTSHDADREVDGIRSAAQLLNQMEAATADEILDGMESETDTVADDIRRAMFTFEDLISLDKRGFAALLKEVQSDALLVALKTASNELREKVFSSLSKRAAEMLKDDLEVMRPVRLSDVQEAQQAIVSTALQLKSEGKLAIAGAGDDYV